MFADAAGFAALSALTPTAILVVAVYLGSASPHRTMLVFLAGALAMTVTVAIVALVALRAGGLSLPGHHQPRYGLRLGLGVLALAAGVIVARRRPRPHPEEKKKDKRPSLISRMLARPGPVAAFVTGLIVFTPSVQFLAAIQVIATAKASTIATTGAVILVVVIDVMLVWLPLGFYLARPEVTTRGLTALNGWLRGHGRHIATAALLVAGAILTATGISGLV
jgi:hypothetical protein